MGEKNIKTIIGNRITPITLSNKKEKYTPNFANDFMRKTCPKRRIIIVLIRKKTVIIIATFQKSKGVKFSP